MIGSSRLHISRDPFTSRSVFNMDVFEDNLCLILDLEGFFINKTFHVRELGYHTWNGEHGRHAFSIPIPYKTLNDKDKRTVNFVCHKIHGLTYQPCDPERFQDPRVLGPLVKDLHDMYVRCSEGQRTVVGYKGGHVEKDLLQKLNIPSLNLETLGCPKYDDLKSEMLPLLPSCSFHKDSFVHHCPVKECHAFWKWYQSISINKCVP